VLFTVWAQMPRSTSIDTSRARTTGETSSSAFAPRLLPPPNR